MVALTVHPCPAMTGMHRIPVPPKAGGGPPGMPGCADHAGNAPGTGVGASTFCGTWGMS